MGLHIHIGKKVVLLEVKTLDGGCKKTMYIEAKHGKNFIDAVNTSKEKGKKT